MIWLNDPIITPPKIDPTQAGMIPRVDLNMNPVIAPQTIFLFLFDKLDNSSSKKKFKVLPVI
jgi:hypothetical protein